MQFNTNSVNQLFDTSLKLHINFLVLCSTRLSLGMWPLILIRLVWWLQIGNAIPDRFAGISGLSLLNPGIPGLIPGLNRARLWLAIAGLVIGEIATRTTRYRLNCAMHIVGLIGRLSCTFLHWCMVFFSNYVSHVTNTHVHYSIKVSKKRSIVSLSDSMVNLSA